MISKSPDRNSFHKNSYLRRCEERGEEPDPEYVDLFQGLNEQEESKWHDPKYCVNNLEYDLCTTEWILEKTRSDSIYAQNLYAALCNNKFIKREMWCILKEEKWSCSWRYAGGIIADMLGTGDYIDWYCSGSMSPEPIDQIEWDNLTLEQQQWNKQVLAYVSEGQVTDEIENDLSNLGWIVVKYNGDK